MRKTSTFEVPPPTSKLNHWSWEIEISGLEVENWSSEVENWGAEGELVC